MVTQARFDDATFGAFLRELEDIESQVDREETADLPFAAGTIVPLDIQNKPHIRSVTYRRVSKVGAFKLVGNYFTSVPMINTLVEEFTQKVFKWAGGYWVSDDDLEAYQATREVSLEQEDVAGVVEVGNQTLNDLICFGDKSIGMHGFVNHPDALYSFSALPLNASSTPRQCLAILADSVSAVVELTLQIEKPDTLLLPLRQYNYLTNTPWSDNDGSSILDQFLRNNPYIKNIQPLNELLGAGLDGLDIMMIYKRDPNKVKAKIMQPLSWKQLERKGLGFERPAVMKYAGLQVRRPYSIHIVAGI